MSPIAPLHKDVAEVQERTRRLDQKTDRRKFFWNYCYLEWTMKEPVNRVHQLSVKLAELEEQYLELGRLIDAAIVALAACEPRRKLKSQLKPHTKHFVTTA